MTVRHLFRLCSELAVLASLVCVGFLSTAQADDKASVLTDVRTVAATERVTDGSLQLVNIAFTSLAPDAAAPPLSVQFEGLTLPVYELKGAAKGRRFQAIFGVPFGHKAGQVAASVRIGKGPEERIVSVPFEVIDGHYPSEKLHTDPRFTKPSKAELEEIRRDAAEAGAVYKIVTEKKYWEGPFKAPIAKLTTTSGYGTKRVFNGEMQSFHQGIDLRARMGTPVHASAAGVVALAKKLYMSGNSVLIDHGYGLYTVYFHMNKLKVRKGDFVKAGTIVGLSGMTGRSSGPHLHWGAVINKAKVNPMDLTKVME